MDSYPIGSVFRLKQNPQRRFVITDRFTREGEEFVSLYGPFPHERKATEEIITLKTLVEYVESGVLTPSN